jgi:hypothetical protein
MDLGLRLTAVMVFRAWARRHRNLLRPFSEVIGGARFTPLDLLVEPPPLIGEREVEYLEQMLGVPASLRYGPRPLVTIVRGLRVGSRAPRSRVWPHVLNLVAVQAEDGAADVYELLGDLHERHAKAGGSVATSDA